MAYGYDYSAPNGSGNIQGYNPDYTNVANTQNQNSQNFNQSQNNQVGNFTSAYQSAVNALPTYQTLLNNANQQYNVDALSKNATDLTNQVLRLPSENYGMTQGSDTNQAQLDQMTGVQQYRLQPLATAATNNAQTAQTLANNMVNYGIQNETQQLSPYANTVGLQNTLLSNAATNFTQQQSDQLTALTAKMNAGVTLTKDEQDNLTSLQQAKYTYDAAIATANATTNAATIKNNMVQNIAAGTIQYDPATGTWKTITGNSKTA